MNDLDPEILEGQQGLFFHLQQQRLIELIRGGQLAEALEFAQARLALAAGRLHPAHHARLCGKPQRPLASGKQALHWPTRAARLPATLPRNRSTWRHGGRTIRSCWRSWVG